MNSGLYALAGASATATAAACANRLLAPMTKVSKVYFGFSRAGSPGLLPWLSHLFGAGLRLLLRRRCGTAERGRTRASAVDSRVDARPLVRLWRIELGGWS